MSYIAKHYVDISRRMYTPGEIVDVKIPENKLDRLLEKGAIIPAAEGGLVKNEPAVWEDERNEPEPEHGEETAEETEEAEEVEAPEIDVMNGVISAPEAETEPPKKTAKGRKKA